MSRAEIINLLIEKFNYQTYLEIGVERKSSNFDLIIAPNKKGVDPDSNAAADYILTSDEFFEKNSEKYDIIFIDGLHLRDQFIRDVENSLKFLNDNGTIVCHDCLPSSFEEQDGGPLPSRDWTGDVWKGITHFRMTRPDLSIQVVDTDFGCGIIRKGNQKLFVNETKQEIDYYFYEKNKKDLMNVITTEEFLRAYSN